MKRITQLIIIIKCLLLLSAAIKAQKKPNIPKPWDQRIIEDAYIWKNIMVNYLELEDSLYWLEREQALIKVINEFPESRWADDAALFLSTEKAIIENNLDTAIVELKEIINKYPEGNTIISTYNGKFGCLINKTWLMWASSRVFLNEDFSIRTSFPFNKDGVISILENEALSYFAHLEKYPQKTKDVAQYIIALTLYQKGDINGAISELKAIIDRYPDLAKIRKHDFEAAKKKNGYLIEFEPPSDRTPIWRIQYAASLKLITLYSQQGNIEKFKYFSSKIVEEVSPDGWYWNINRYIGKLYAKNELPKLALNQYNLSMIGIQEKIEKQGIRMEALYKNGNLQKSNNFTNREDEAKKSNFVYDISEIKLLKTQLK